MTTVSQYVLQYIATGYYYRKKTKQTQKFISMLKVALQFVNKVSHSGIGKAMRPAP
jgi:thioredoxin-related protein